MVAVEHDAVSGVVAARFGLAVRGREDGPCSRR